jgi:hypothetical protein
MAVPRVNQPGRIAGLVTVALLAAGCTGPGPGPTPSPGPTTPAVSPTVASVEVPALVGLSRVRAIETVLSLGLNVRVLPLGKPPNSSKKDEVARQVPFPGSGVALGAEVLIGAYCLPAPCPSPDEDETIYDPCTCATRS